MEEQMSGALEPIVSGLSANTIRPFLQKLYRALVISVRDYGSTKVSKYADYYMRAEIRSTSLNSLLISYLSKFPIELGEIIEECLTLITPDTVACGATTHKRMVVEIIPGKLSFDIGLGDFYDDWTGCRVWPAAYVLSQQLLIGEFPVTDCEVLELGSGLGVCGIAAMHARAFRTTFSEHNDNLLKRCLSNVDMNLPPGSPANSFIGIHLDWETIDTSPEFLTWSNTRSESKEFVFIGSEVVFENEHPEMILMMLETLFLRGASRGLLVLMLKPERRGVENFINLLTSKPSGKYSVKIQTVKRPQHQLAACLQFYSID